MKPYSVWLEGMGPTRNSLNGNKSDKVAVVGGSFNGLSTAYHLLQEGYAGTDITILDKGYIGQAPGRSAGQLAKSTETDFLDDVNELGEEGAKHAWESQRESIDILRRIISQYGLDCGFESNGSRYYGSSEDIEYLQDEAAARNRNGFPVEIRRTPQLGDNDVYLFDPTDCTIDPARYCAEFAKSLEKEGVRIYENTPVTSLDSGIIQTPGGRMDAGRIVLSGQNVPGSFGLGKRAIPVETYCMATRPLAQDEIRGIGLEDRAIFWGSDVPYFYGKLTPDDRLLVGGGDLVHYPRWIPFIPQMLDRRKKRQLKGRFVEYFPQFTESDIDYSWGGTMHVTTDFLPVVGSEGNIIYSGNAAGIPHATLLGKVVASRIAGKQTEYDELFDAKRKTGIVPKVEGGLWKNLQMYARALGY